MQYVVGINPGMFDLTPPAPPPPPQFHDHHQPSTTSDSKHNQRLNGFPEVIGKCHQNRVRMSEWFYY